MSHWRNTAFGLVLLTLLADLGLAVPALRYGAAFFLLWIGPGLAWGWHLAGGRRPGIEEGTVGLGLGFGTTSLLALALSYLPGPFSGRLLAVSLHLLIASTILPPRYRGHRDAWGTSGNPSVSLRVLCVVVVVISSLFRLVSLGYSEFQGDEGVIMVRAAGILTGSPDQLFLHQKGPLEVLVPMSTWSLSTTINEVQARLPFGLAGIVGVLAVSLLGARLLNRRAGLIGGLLLAVNGYFVGFGRIVQYQSLVLMMTGLGLLALWLWQEGGEDRWLLAGAFLLACGLLAHYDAALALPAALYMIVGGLHRRGTGGTEKKRFSLRSPLRSLGLWGKPSIPPSLVVAVALAVAVLVLFYAPFALHPNFAKTAAYLRAERVGTGGPVYNNLLRTLPLTTLYNSTYYVVFLALMLAVAGFRPFRRWGLVVPAACVLLLVVGAGPVGAGLRARPEATTEGQATTEGRLYGAAVAAVVWPAAVVVSRRTSPGERAVWLWFAAPFLFHYFLVWDPRTHVLNAFPAASLLAAFPLGELWAGQARRSAPIGRVVRRVALLVGLALYVLFGYYIWMMFVDHTPEYRRTWPEHRSPVYWTPYEELPRFGLFGFPYRAGWKVVGALMAEGDLTGVYASNEEEEITRWYTRGAERTYCPGPDLYLIAARVQDEMPVDQVDLEANYHLAAVVRVGGEPRLWLYRPGPPQGEPAVYDVEDFEGRFDAGMTPEAVLPRPPADVTPVGAVLGDRVRLAGYRLDTTDARPGGSLRLTLYWEPLVPMRTGYQVFTHLYDGTMWGQHDSTPGCGLWPTTRWEPGRWVRDDHVLPIAEDAPAGEIPLLVGMYDLGTGTRLPVTGPGGRGDSVVLTTVVLP